jgi:hypothetical protein
MTPETSLATLQGWLPAVGTDAASCMMLMSSLGVQWPTVLPVAVAAAVL